MPRDLELDVRLRRTDLAGIMVLCLCAAVWIAVRLNRPRITFADHPPADAQRARIAEQRIDPNTASVASMLRLRGIGPVKAKAIVTYRDQHGPGAFETADDLTNVDGISTGTVRRIARELSLPAGSD